MTNLFDAMTYPVAFVAACVAAVVSFLGGFDLGHSAYDFLTVGTAGLSFLSGVKAVYKCIGSERIGLRAIAKGDPWARGAALIVVSTGLSAYHLILMTYWSFQPGEDILNPEINAAFENWHILIAMFFFYLHSWFYRAMKDVEESQT